VCLQGNVSVREENHCNKLHFTFEETERCLVVQTCHCAGMLLCS